MIIRGVIRPVLSEQRNIQKLVVFCRKFFQQNLIKLLVIKLAGKVTTSIKDIIILNRIFNKPLFHNFSWKPSKTKVRKFGKLHDHPPTPAPAWTMWLILNLKKNENLRPPLKQNWNQYLFETILKS